LNKEITTPDLQKEIADKVAADGTSSPDKGFTLLDVYMIYRQHRKVILGVTLVVCILAIVMYYFVMDPIFMSTATIKSTSKGGGLSGMLEGTIPDIGGLDDLTGMGAGRSARELAAYQSILTSRRCLEEVLNKFGFMEREEIDYMEDGVKYVRANMSIGQDRLAGTLSVGFYDKDPVLARDVVEYLISQLDKINIELNIQNAKSNREFIEKRYYQAKEDLAKAEDSLKAFQVIYGIAPDLQTKAAAQSAFTLEAELKAEEVKLDILRGILSPDQLEVKTQEAKIQSLREQIGKIQTSTDLNDLLRLGNSPQIVMSFYRLSREVEIQNKIVTFLLPLYEQAKIEEKRETPTIMVLDKPYVAERKSKPRRLTMVVVLTFLSFMSANIFFIFRYKWRNFREMSHI
jgi:tyrosine-protein kinase Etk/Wzc